MPVELLVRLPLLKTLSLRVLLVILENKTKTVKQMSSREYTGGSDPR